VLHVTSGLDIRSGGPAVSLAGLATGQNRAGLRVEVLATYRAGCEEGLEQQMRKDGVAVRCVGPCTGRFARCRDLNAAVATSVRNADVVHIHALFEEVQYLTAKYARERGIPYIIRPCGMLDPWSLRRNWLAKRLYMAWRLSRMLQSAAAIHYTTNFERQEAGQLALPNRTIVEPNGVDLTEYATLPPEGAFRGRFGIPVDAPLVTFLGRVHPGKGVEHLVKAIAAGSLARARLAIVGPDSAGHLADMRSLAASLGVADRVVFTGLLRGAERISALVDADVFALPSDHENFGVAVAEAMAAGTPVIVSPEVGIADDVTMAGAGAVVASNATTLAAEVTRWIDDPNLRATAGSRGRSFAMRQYDWSEIGRRWSGHYASLLRQPLSA